VNPQTDYKYDAYISYNRRTDADIAKALAQRLAMNGIRLFLDEWQLSAGDLWQSKIRTALDESRFIIVIISSSGLQSPWMGGEVGSAFTPKPGLLLPIVVDEALIPTVLRNIESLRINRDDERSFDVAVEEVTRVIRQSRTAEESQRPETLATLADQSESLPALDYKGVLPQGIHSASLEEVVNRFGSGSAQRDRLARELTHLADKAREVKAQALVLGGSFISADPNPADLDAVIVFPEEAREDVSPSDLDIIRSQVINSKGTFVALGEDLAHLWTNVLENTYTGEPRGVVEIDLSKDAS
jgi:hypothetical protein